MRLHTSLPPVFCLIALSCGTNSNRAPDPGAGIDDGSAGEASGSGGESGSGGSSMSAGAAGGGGSAGGGGAAGANGGAGGTTDCGGYYPPCAGDEYCLCEGSGCAKRPSVCPGECQYVCGCKGGIYCNDCVAHMNGTGDWLYSSCSSDGGAPGYGTQEAGAPCSHAVYCAGGLNCCYECSDAEGCRGRCSSPEGGVCPEIQHD